MHQHNPENKEMIPSSFFCVLTIIEHHEQELYAFPKVRVISSLGRPETQLRLLQYRRSAEPLLGSNIICQKTITAVNGEELQKTVNI